MNCLSAAGPAFYGARWLLCARAAGPNRIFRSPVALHGAYSFARYACKIPQEHGLRANQVLKELLGYPHLKLYDGSWIEWSNVPELPIETGKD